MALTPEEMKELESLRAELSQQRAPSNSGLTPEEMAELQALRTEFGGDRSPGQIPLNSLPENQGNVPEGQLPGQNQAPVSQGFWDKAQTQLESFGNTVSFGYLPQIQAAFEKINPDPTGGIDDELRAQGFNIPEHGYVQMRDENIRRQEEQALRNPADALAGSIAGMATQAPIIAERAAAFGLGKVPGLVNRIKDSATTGFGLGAITNPGDIEGQVNLLQGSERLSNAGMGGAFGAAGQSVGEFVAKSGATIKNAPKTLEKLSKIKAFKAAGAMLKDFRNARGDKAAEEVGETLLKKGIVSAGDSLEDIAGKTVIAKTEAGQRIRDVYSQVKQTLDNPNLILKPKEARLLDSTKLNGEKIAGDIRVRLLKTQKATVGSSEVKGKIDEILADITALGDDVNIADMLAARNSLDKRINYGKKVGELPLLQQQMSAARQEITKAIQNRVRAVGVVTKDKSLINTLKEANKEFGQLSMVEDFATDKISRENANRFFSLGDRLGSVSGATIGALSGDTPEEKIKNGLIGLATGAVAEKYGRYSLPMISRAAKGLGEALKKPAAFAKYGEPLIEAAKRSPQEFQALLNQLGKDPEFVKLATPAGGR